MSCHTSMLKQPSLNQDGGACGACQSTLFGGKKKAPKSSARRSYRRRVSKSKCKGKRASTLFKLVSTAGTGYFYTARRNLKQKLDKMVFRKY